MPPIETPLHQLLETFHRRHSTSSVVLQIESVDGGFGWSHGIGPANNNDPRPITAASPFFAASITKLYVTALILRLVDRGLVQLTSRLVDIIDDDVRGLHVMRGVDRTHELTVSMALSHRTGLPNYLEDRQPDREVLLKQALAPGGDRIWNFNDVIEISRRIGPKFEPGAGRKAHYSDTNFQLLGRVVEHVTGAALDDALAEHICQPLGLGATTLFHEARAPTYQSIATMYHGTTALQIPKVMTSVGADGGLVTTAAEGIRFLRAFFGGELFDAEQLDALYDWRRIFFPLQYGVGVMRFRLPRALTGFGQPVEMVGHSGASGAVLFYEPNGQLMISGTINQMEPRSLPYKLAVRALALAAKARTNSRVSATA
jgi:D-alanyl-D-alanine carboxypeptidase